MACMVLVLPFLLNRVLNQYDYSVWVLGFKVALYVPIFRLGIYQLLKPPIAQHLARDEHELLQLKLASATDSSYH